MPRKPRKKYTGILAEPIDLAGGVEAWGPEMERRFEALFAHYGIKQCGKLERDDLIDLVWEMAAERFPGFRPPQEQRKPRLAVALRKLLSYPALGMADVKGGGKVSQAAEQFARWWRRLGYDVTGETIRQDYIDLRAKGGVGSAEWNRLRAMLDEAR
jgi:hypothetical protein